MVRHMGPMKLVYKVLASISFPLVVAIGLGVAPVAMEGCGTTGQQIQTAAGPVSQAALDGITCVTSFASLVLGPQSIPGIVAACSKFAVSADLAYVVIKSMINTSTSPADAGVGAADPVLTAHLLKLLSTK